jgi:glycosyltransferase involved in cell wall biosynthesis
LKAKNITENGIGKGITLAKTLDLSEELRRQRVVIEQRSQQRFQLTVFLGLYNAERYINSLQDQISGQILKGYTLIVVDNHSGDSTWQLIQEWPGKFECNVVLVKNPINLGGSGSINLNLDLVNTEWVTYLHQDDFYFSYHLDTLLTAAERASNETVSISTSMGSMDGEGKRIPGKIRAGWLLTNKNRETNFLANLRSQSVPWGSTIFRTQGYREVVSNWHSNAFPDTEMILKLLCIGETDFLNIETMLYRENPLSESHRVQKIESSVASATSLARVFSSDNFIKFTSELDINSRSQFFTGVMSAISIRLGKNNLTPLIQLIAAESLSVAWDYSEFECLESLKEIYKNLNSDFTVNLMSDLGKFLFDTTTRSSLDRQAVLDFQSLVSVDEKNVRPNLEHIKRVTRFLDSKILDNLPNNVRQKVLIWLLNFKIKITRNHPWDFRWKK